MTHRAFLTSFTLLSVALAGCGDDADRSAASNNAAARAAAQRPPDAVRQLESQMLSAFQAKDASRLAAHYAPNALLALPGRTVRGSDAVAEALAADFADPNFKLNFTNERVDSAASGDLAWTSGSYEASWTDPQTRRVESGEGTYVTIFRKQDDGSWKVVADIATPKASAPPAGAPPAGAPPAAGAPPRPGAPPGPGAPQ